MAKGDYKVPDEKKKTCPYCGMRVSKQGWKMHYNFKHPDEEFVSFEEASGGKITTPKPPKEKKESGGDESFPGRESGSSEGGDKDGFWGDKSKGGDKSW